MIVREVTDQERALYNSVVNHPLQSWEWGEFRKQTGTQVKRIGFYHQGKLTRGFQVTFHPIPHLNKNAGYLPKAFMPDDEQLHALKEVGKQHNALFIKLEPNVAMKVGSPSAIKKSPISCAERRSPSRPLFTRYSFHLKLDKPEEELSKT